MKIQKAELATKLNKIKGVVPKKTQWRSYRAFWLRTGI